MTVHASVLEFLITACYIIIFGFFVRTFSAKYPDNPVSKAMGFIY